MKKRIWTVKTKEEIDILNKKGYLTSNKKIVDKFWNCSNFKNAYEWMNRQMKNKLSKKTNSIIWAWEQRPDFRSYRVEIPKGGELYLLEIEKDENEILISNFDLWHCILSGFPILSKKEDLELEKKYGKDYYFSYWANECVLNGKRKKIPKYMKNMILKSWEKVFMRDKKWEDKNQIVFEKLYKNEILSIKKYERK